MTIFMLLPSRVLDRPCYFRPCGSSLSSGDLYIPEICIGARECVSLSICSATFGSHAPFARTGLHKLLVLQPATDENVIPLSRWKCGRIAAAERMKLDGHPPTLRAIEAARPVAAPVGRCDSGPSAIRELHAAASVRKLNGCDDSPRLARQAKARPKPVRQIGTSIR
jgi:hypothetical protein